MKISYKILFPLLIVTFVTFSILTYLMSSFSEQTFLLKGFYTHNLKNQEKIVTIDALFSSAHASIPEMIIANMMGEKKEKILQKSEYNQIQLEKCLIDLKTINHKQYTEKEKKLIKKIISTLTDYIPFFKKISNICMTGDSYSATEQYPGLEKKGTTIKKHLKALISMESYLTDQAIQDTIFKATQKTQTIEMIIKLGGCFTLFLLIMTILLTSRYIILPIRRLVSYVQTISKGDFTEKLNLKQKDE
ncbi:Methyl-accepting chemotaxis protein, partial [Candidatus Magnetomorum sp. HK-1]